MAVFLIFGLLPAFISGSLFIVREMRGPRTAWMVAIAMAVVLSVAAFKTEPPSSESSAFAAAVGGSLSVFVAALVIMPAPARLGRAGTLVVAALLSAVCFVPGYLIGCMIADFLPVNGCFF